MPTGVRPGDRVRFTPYAEGDLRPFTVAGVDYFVVDYREILCVIEE
jgi:co-chaperonin GroES (HSP10)